MDWLPGQQLTVVGGALLCLSAGGALVSLVVRFRHADQLVRQQLKWVGLAGALLLLFLPVATPCGACHRSSGPLASRAVGMTLALGAAVLRYRLFDVDLIILRSVGYVCASVVVLAVYAAVSVLPGYRPRTLVGLAGGRRDPGRSSGLPARLRAVRRFWTGASTGTAMPPGCRSTPSSRLCDRAPSTPTGSRTCFARRCVTHSSAVALLPASDGFADLRGRPAELEPGLAAVRVERDGVPEAVVQYLDTGDPARQSRVRQLVEHGRLALQVARLASSSTASSTSSTGPGPGSRRPPTRSVAASSATCMTVPNSGW